MAVTPLIPAEEADGRTGMMPADVLITDLLLMAQQTMVAEAETSIAEQVV